MQKNGKIQVAKIMYSMGVYYKHLPQEQEEALMGNDKLVPGVKHILKDGVFKKMLELEELDKLAERAIKGGGELTNAYLNAAEALKPENQRSDPKQKTLEDKINVWKDKELGVQ